MKRYDLILIAMAGIASVMILLQSSACSGEMKTHVPESNATTTLPDLPDPGDIHTYNAPLYWSVYEYCYELEKAGVPSSEMDITSQEWDNIINWVSEELQPYGYDMICTDGFIPMLAKDAGGYMTHYGSVSLAELVAKCRSKGLKLGVYDNPLWIHGPANTRIPGTNYTFGSLTYNGSQVVNNPNAQDTWFTWAIAENPGTKEYIDAFFKHYHDLGVEFIRMDFLSWYEDGKDRGMGIVGKGYGRESYTRALAYIADSAKKYGIFTSLVMPHLYNDAELESKYGNMFRIVADTGNGGWNHFSATDKGKLYYTWPNCNNMFDGFVHWSHVGGRNKVILDGDFTRLNKFTTTNEKQSVISLQLLAGGPIAVADQFTTIGDNLQFYTNSELLELNKEGFVGKPLSDSLTDKNNEIWVGEMKNHDVIIGFFNRDDSPVTKSVSLSQIDLTGEWEVRDLWSHSDEGTVSETIECTLPAHGCKIVRLSQL